MSAVPKMCCKDVVKIFYKSVKILSKAGKCKIYIIVILTIISGVLPSVFVWVTRKILNLVQIGEPFNIILLYCIIYVTLDILTIIISKLNTYISFIFDTKVNLYLSSLINLKLQSLELEDFEDTEIYNLIKRAEDQGGGRILSYFNNFLNLFQSIITIVTNLMIIFIQLSVIIYFLPIIIVITVFKTLAIIRIGKKRYEINRKRANEDRKRWYFKYLLSNDLAFKEIKLFNLCKHFFGKYCELFDEAFKQNKKITIEEQLKDFLYTLFDRIFIGLIFLFTIHKAYIHEILIGDATTFIKGINNVKSGIVNLCSQVSTIFNNAYYVYLIFEFLDYKSRSSFKKEGIKLLNIENIEFVNVSFSYNDCSSGIKNFSFHFSKGGMYSLIGKNGSGKSTLVKLLSGLYSNYGGSIYVNGIELHEIDILSYRKLVSAQFQDFMRYELSLKENIALGNLNKINNSNEMLMLLKDIGFKYSDKGALEMQLGYWFDNGRQLSGGEWLKVAVARACFRENANLYIFDEPNSAMDIEASNRFLKMISINNWNKVNVFVIHHLEYMKEIDCEIIFLKNDGYITGTHTKLLAEDVDYQNMVLAQTG